MICLIFKLPRWRGFVNRASRRKALRRQGYFGIIAMKESLCENCFANTWLSGKEWSYIPIRLWHRLQIGAGGGKEKYYSCRNATMFRNEGGYYRN